MVVTNHLLTGMILQVLKGVICVKVPAVRFVLGRFHPVKAVTPTWRIIPVSKWRKTYGYIVSPPKDRVGWDPFQMAELHGLYPP